MKKGWQRKSIGEILQLKYGKPLDDSLRTEHGAYPVYGANGEKDRTDRFYYDKPSIIVGRKGSAGEVNLTEQKFWPLDVTYFVSYDENRHELRFLYYLLTSLDLKKLAKGVKPGINRNEIYTQNARVPSLTEQQRIVRILDEAFDAIATAKANTEKNLQNARALFESHLQSVFIQPTTAVASEAAKNSFSLNQAEMKRLHPGYVTRTGGREATTRHIPPRLSLAVGVPKSGSRKGWCWSALSDLARLESGHTPSRKHPEYWGGTIHWIGIQDARNNHGRTIESTAQTINELGTKNSSARLLPAGTVCLSRTASVGYVVVMGCPMATSQDFVNWVCSGQLLPDFLKYLFLAERREGLLRFASGSVHQTIYFPEAKAFHICHPEVREQSRIVRLCDELSTETQRLRQRYEQKLSALDALKKSLLHQAFSGKL